MTNKIPRAETDGVPNVEDMQHRIEVGRRLVFARMAVGKKRKEWMDEYNLSSSKLSQWERGLYYPNMTILTKICSDHNISLDYLFRGVRPRHRVPANKSKA